MSSWVTVDHRGTVGELNDNLLPVGEESVMALVEELADDDMPLHGRSRPGSNRTQYYKKMTASALSDCLPVVSLIHKYVGTVVA